MTSHSKKDRRTARQPPPNYDPYQLPEEIWGALEEFLECSIGADARNLTQMAVDNYLVRRDEEMKTKVFSSQKFRGARGRRQEIKKGSPLAKFQSKANQLFRSWNELLQDPASKKLINEFDDTWITSERSEQSRTLERSIGDLSQQMTLLRVYLAAYREWSERRPAFDRFVEGLGKVFESETGAEPTRSKRVDASASLTSGRNISAFPNFVWEIFDHLPHGKQDPGLGGSDPICAFEQRV